jgi:uncharacterized membrane protein YccC
MPRPATAGSSLAFLIGVAGTLSLQDTGTLDIPSFLNSMVAQLFGFIAAAVITSLIRTVGGDWMARRMLRTARREVAQMTKSASADSLLTISARMVDRIGLLMPRLAVAHPTPEARAWRWMACANCASACTPRSCAAAAGAGAGRRGIASAAAKTGRVL